MCLYENRRHREGKEADTEKEKKHTPGSGAGVELGTMMGAAQGIALSWSTSPWSSQDTRRWFTAPCPCPALPSALVSFLLLSHSSMFSLSSKISPDSLHSPRHLEAPITLWPLDECPSFQSVHSLWTWLVLCTSLYFPHIQSCGAHSSSA